MKTLTILSILLIGLFNTVSAMYFLGQDTGTSLIGMTSAIVVVAVLWLFRVDVTRSYRAIWLTVLAANIAVAGGVGASHAIPSVRAILYTPSTKFVKQQKAYEKLLD